MIHRGQPIKVLKAQSGASSPNTLLIIASDRYCNTYNINGSKDSFDFSPMSALNGVSPLFQPSPRKSRKHVVDSKNSHYFILYIPYG